MLGGPLKRSGCPPPSGSVTPPRCGLFLRRRSQKRLAVIGFELAVSKSQPGPPARPPERDAHRGVTAAEQAPHPRAGPAQAASNQPVSSSVEIDKTP